MIILWHRRDSLVDMGDKQANRDFAYLKTLAKMIVDTSDEAMFLLERSVDPAQKR